MNTTPQTPCSCASCPGTACTCGCRQPTPQAVAPTACACGPQCACGTSCSCGAACTCGKA